MSDRMTVQEFRESEGTEDWPVLSDGAVARFRTASLAQAAAFVGEIAKLPEVDARRPAIDIRHDAVTIQVVTMEDGLFGMTRADLELVRAISTIARSLGLTPDSARVQSLLLVPGAPKGTKIFDFWRAVLDYEPRPDSPDEDLVDPRAIGASFWFESMREPRGDGGGAIHVAVFVPYEEAERRVAAALAAGGRMVRDDFSPMWWTLADAAGNEVDVATTMGRE